MGKTELVILIIIIAAIGILWGIEAVHGKEECEKAINNESIMITNATEAKVWMDVQTQECCAWIDTPYEDEIICVKR